MRYTILLSTMLIVCISCHTNQAESNIKEASKDDIPAKKESIESSRPIYEKISFTASDGLPVTANLYYKSNEVPTIVLCHQARFNKYEYHEIAPKLWEKGFNCLVIDQRSGGSMNKIYHNETAQMAIHRGLRAEVINDEDRITDYLSAEPDIKAAIDYAYEKYGKPVLLWGSSYSSTLALYLAQNNDKVQAVISFSPGNYFEKYKGSLTEVMADFNKAFFITSSKKESEGVATLLSKANLKENQQHFIPEHKGYHGSKALWEENTGHEEYWEALNAFLKPFLDPAFKHRDH